MIVGPGEGVSVETFVARYPRLYHMAELGSLDSILTHGLLSTSALLDLFEVTGTQRQALEAELRLRSQTVSHPKLGKATIRDQCPMSVGGLERCLEDGLTPKRWLRILNKRVFFWVAEERLHGLLEARNYVAHEHDVLILDSGRLLADYERQVELSPINSGATKPYPRPRGKDTFLPLDTYPWAHWIKARGRNKQTAVELTVTGGVRDVDLYLLEAWRMKGRKKLKRLR